MVIMMRRFFCSVAGLAFVLTPATPAMAGWGGVHVSSGYGWGSGYGRGFRHRHYRHRDRLDAGDVIGAIAVVGIIAAIASSASRAKDRPVARNQSGRIVGEDAAVDACADAAEQQAGTRSSVRDITQVDRTTDGWDVEGVIEQRGTWRDDGGEERRFTCSVRLGRVDHVYIDTETLALR